MIAENHRERGTLMLDFRVETFLAVCRHMNFTKAARELSITQPAVSHHIRYLEQAYGAALFRHNGKRLQLTEAGEILRRTLLTMKHDEQHLQKRMQQAATGTRDYSFGATLSVAEFMLNEALGRFLHLHPDSRIRMQVADTKVLLSKLDSGELDFAVVEGDFPKAEYDFFVFGTEEYVAAAAPDKAARYRGRQLTQLLGEPLLLREEGSGTRVILEYYLKERGLAAADFARTVEIGNIGAIKTLLKSGYGVSFLYRAAIRPEEAAGTLGVIELSDFSSGTTSCSSSRKTATSAPTTRPSFRSCAPVRSRTARARAPKREKASAMPGRHCGCSFYGVIYSGTLPRAARYA